MRRFAPSLKPALAAILLALALTGCHFGPASNQTDPEPAARGFNLLPAVGHFAENRFHDFTDCFQAGVGVVGFENESGPHKPIGGVLPVNPVTIPMLGLHAQVTEFIKLGYFHFNGYSAEWDGRGFFAGPERRTRFGLFAWEMVNLEQQYDRGIENYFKKSDTRWALRMLGEDMMWRNVPAKELNYRFWAEEFHLGLPPFRRGWQHFANVEIEVAAIFMTMRLGADVSEAVDCLLGWVPLNVAYFWTDEDKRTVFIDYKRDDLTRSEYREKRRRGLHLGTDYASEPKPASDVR